MILEVLNPRAELDAAPVQGLAAPRLDTLNGKKIALLGVKPDSLSFSPSSSVFSTRAFPRRSLKSVPSAT
jgi:hypothetical protein